MFNVAWALTRNHNLEFATKLLEKEAGKLEEAGMEESADTLRLLAGKVEYVRLEFERIPLLLEGEEVSDILLPQEEFARVRMAERQRCAEIADGYKHTCSCHIADDIAALIRTESLK